MRTSVASRKKLEGLSYMTSLSKIYYIVVQLSNAKFKFETFEVRFNFFKCVCSDFLISMEASLSEPLQKKKYNKHRSLVYDGRHYRHKTTNKDKTM